MNYRIKDLTGKKFGYLEVIGLDEEKSNRKTYWNCICECGSIVSVRSDTLQLGKSSCGCKKVEMMKNNTYQRTHNMSKTRIYKIWQGMKKRCMHDTRNKSNHIYYDKNIKVCEEWLNSFETFNEWAIENGYNDTLSIDRIDNNGNYEPNNCRWATPSEQARNRDTNINIRIGNVVKTLTEWCEIFEIDYNMCSARFKRKEDVSLDYLFEPRLYANTEITN